MDLFNLDILNNLRPENGGVIQFEIIQQKNNGSQIVDVQLFDNERNLTDNGTVKVFQKKAKKKAEKERIFHHTILTFLHTYVSNFQHKNDEFKNCFPILKYIRSIKSLDDGSCLLIMENLRCQNFENISLKNGIQLSTAKEVITNLANFHSVVMIMKRNNHEEYETFLKVAQLEDKNYRNVSRNNHIILDLFSKIEIKFSVNGVVDSDVRLILDTLRDKYINTEETFSENPTDNLYSTLILGNCYIGNILVNQTNDIKFLDFTCYRIGSFAIDFLNFYFCSLSTDLINNHTNYGHLYRSYHRRLKWHLSNLNEIFDMESGPFSETTLIKEIERVAKDRFFINILSTLNDVLNSNQNIVETHLPKSDYNDLKENCKNRMIVVFDFFKKSNWI